MLTSDNKELSPHLFRGFTLKTDQMFSVHITPDMFQNTTIGLLDCFRNIQKGKVAKGWGGGGEDMSRSDPNWMHADFNERHEVFPWSSPQLQHYSFPGILTISVTKCLPNAVPQVRINSCIYLKTKIALTFTLTLLLEIGSKGLDFKGHFVLDVKIERASN